MHIMVLRIQKNAICESSWYIAKVFEKEKVNKICCDRKTCFPVMSHGELSFLDLQEVGGVDGRGMALDVLFSWILTYFLT